MVENTRIGEKALILSDNERLYGAIASYLNDHLAMQVVRHTPGDPELAQSGHVDLIVVAQQSSMGGEPTMALIKTLLTGQVGQVPALIVSNGRFDLSGAQAFNVDFPLDVDKLCVQVKGILQKGDEPGALGGLRRR